MMATAVLGGIIARNRTGEGQWIDFSCTEAGIGLAGPDILDSTVNGRPMRRAGKPNSNADNWPPMAPHGVYPAAGDDNWVAIACRDDADWRRLADAVGEPWARDPALATADARMARRDEIDTALGAWTKGLERARIAALVKDAGVPIGQVARPADRIDHDPRTSGWGLWPEVVHDEIGKVRVEGIPLHLSETDWSITRGAPCLGNDNHFVYGDLLGLSADEIADLSARKVI
jgi:crotonobetainyl-CoA:carnitine CoA-transferase CaiB-like acyl-CoA transferase